MDYGDILDRIKDTQNIEELDVDQVKLCMSSEDFLIRCDTIEAISRYIFDKEIEEIIINGLYDENYTVRCEVYEALELSNDNSVPRKIYDRLRSEKSSIARMYAVSAILSLIKRKGYSNSFLKNLKASFEKEKEKPVIIAYLALFYYVENEIDYIRRALEYLDDEDYHIRCNVINIIGEVLDEENEEMIKNIFDKRYNIELSRAVKSLLENFI